MAICASVINTALVQNSTAIGSCTEYVVLTASDYQSQAPSLSLDDTVELSFLIILVWALAYSFKLIRRAL
jgi:hypothetical protein